MERQTVECLNCGKSRRVDFGMHAGECQRCGYVGWTEGETLTKTLMRLVRDRSSSQRRVAA